jgi:hypothetical protein
VNEELQKKLGEILNAAQSAGKEAFLFTKEQVPDILQQLLMWKLAQAIFFLVIAAGLAVAAYRFYLVFMKGLEDREEGLLALGLFGGIPAAAASLIMGIINAQTAIQIWVAPKVYLLEYAANLIKK